MVLSCRPRCMCADAHADESAVQMLDGELAAQERLGEGELLVEDQVVADALEAVVLGQVEDVHHVAWHLMRTADAGLALSDDPRSVLHALRGKQVRDEIRVRDRVRVGGEGLGCR